MKALIIGERDFYLMADDPYSGENQTLEPPAIQSLYIYY